ncbi:hypothetical protein IFM89_020770 [Coptis chinensis]|uniref:Pentatricopeptide repeat-containing protein n=1 Tax=Coptis chinensis TaxID=261450 RepID=A0A835J133_9MAGN|nr:hypothetical protein IFM89_020770 [Coptis chinensis]
MLHRNVFTWNAIISAHIHNRDITKARHFFDSAPFKDSVTYNTMISAYANTSSLDLEGVKVFSSMQDTGTPFDEFTLTTMLNLTAKLLVLSYGKQLHSDIRTW